MAIYLEAHYRTCVLSFKGYNKIQNYINFQYILLIKYLSLCMFDKIYSSPLQYLTGHMHNIYIINLHLINKYTLQTF